MRIRGLPIIMLAMYAGGRLHTNISQRAFSRLISLLLLGSGLALLLR